MRNAESEENDWWWDRPNLNPGQNDNSVLISNNN
jgi:hypothetical protein